MSGRDHAVAARPSCGADLRTIADLVPALISFYTPDHICGYANAYHRSWCAREPDEYLGLHMKACIGDALYEEHQPFLARVARGETVVFESVAPHRDGGTCRSEIKYLPAYGPDGMEGFHIVVAFPDEAENLHEQFLKSEYRYRNMFRAMAVSFLECDFTAVGAELRRLRAEGVNDLRSHFATHPEIIRRLIRLTQIVDVNDKAVEMFCGNAKEDLLVSCDRFWPEASEPVFANSVIAAVGRVPYFQEETRLRRLDGEEIDVLFTVSFSPETVGAGVILIGIIDITERNRARDALQKALADLAHAARVSMLGELTASIAHEVNQPLAAIVSNGAASLRWLGRDEPDLNEARMAIGRMIEDGRRASQIIARTRMMSSKRSPARAPLNVNEIIYEAVQFLRHEIMAKQVALRLDLAHQLPAPMGDKVQMHQVLVNLMMNAIQALEASEPPRELTVRSRLEHDRVLIEVQDSGHGISPGSEERLFKAFFTTKDSGMGMGLSICATIVSAHGGEINAWNNEGRGATFAFTLPVPGPA